MELGEAHIHQSPKEDRFSRFAGFLHDLIDGALVFLTTYGTIHIAIETHELPQ